MESLINEFNWSTEEQRKFDKLVNNLRKIDNIHINEWLTKLPNELERLNKKWELNSFNIIESGRLGLIMSSYSKKYNSLVVLKMIPDFLNVFQVEYNAYKNLSKTYMCPLFDVDINSNTLLMKKLDNCKGFVFENNNHELVEFFDKVNENTYPFKTKDKSLYYINKLKTNCDVLNSDIKFNSEIKDLCNKAIKLYNKYFKNQEHYLLHSDLHPGNVLYSNNSYYAIDPLGYVAPKSFNFVRTITVELFFSNCYNEYFYELLEYFSRYCDKKTILLELYIDLCLMITSLLIQFKDTDKKVEKVKSIINLVIENYYKIVYEEGKIGNEKSCFVFTKA